MCCKIQHIVQALIHAGTGGVGLSAIQVAKAMGADIIATAGSSSKRSVLREMGVKTVLGSRDSHFASLLNRFGKHQLLSFIRDVYVQIFQDHLHQLSSFGKITIPTPCSGFHTGKLSLGRNHAPGIGGIESCASKSKWKSNNCSLLTKCCS